MPESLSSFLVAVSAIVAIMMLFSFLEPIARLFRRTPQPRRQTESVAAKPAESFTRKVA